MKNVYGETKKWYDTQLHNFDILEPNTDYTVMFDNTQQYTFKTGKNEDTFLKSFVNQYITKASVFNGGMIYLTKEQKRDFITSNINAEGIANRIYKYVYYTTLYGIGMFCFFMNEKTFTELKDKMDSYLKDNSINYKNEYSEARWVYRWCIKSDISVHNTLLKNFTDKSQ